MRITFLPKLLFFVSLLALLCVQATAQAVVADASKVLPEAVGDFRAQGAARPVALELGQLKPEDFQITSTAARDYVSGGEKLRVTLVQTNSASAAYSLLKYQASRPAPSRTQFLEGLGVVSLAGQNRLRFIKGQTFVEVTGAQASADASMREFAQQFAATLEGEEGELPALALHLPDREKVNEKTAYAVTLPALQTAVGRQPVLDAVSFEGGAEAVAAGYDTGRLVIIEYTTPQYAGDNDKLIKERIAQLREAGQPVPTSYRRIGNYSVFVFDAPDEQAATSLVENVKWEKDVRWLGESPNTLKRAQRAYYDMTGSTILNVLIVTGLSILVCLGVGGLFGGAVFLYRRSQSTVTEAFTDAGGMVRLNIDDITPETDASELLGRGDK